MASISAPVSPDSLTHATVTTPWQKAAHYLVRRRVPISAFLLIVMIAEDLLTGVRPHNLANLHDAKSLIGLSLVLAGVALRSWAAGILQKRTQLATNGPYGLIRHPLYLGSFFMTLGFCTLIDDRENFWIVLGPLLLLYVLGILHEERSLAKHFARGGKSMSRRRPGSFPAD